MKRCHVITLGCKVNQCESAALGHLMRKAGYRVDPGHRQADVVIVNTCAVTGKAAMQSRQAVRRAVRGHPHARIVVTGCYAQTAAADIAAIPGVDLIVGHADKLRIAELIASGNAYPSPVENNGSCRLLVSRPAENFAALPDGAATERTRAFLKIQDGCNAMCSYCIVPHARGASRSMPVADVQRQMNLLGEAGFREVVLTGIHLGSYGADLNPSSTLADLLEKLLTVSLPIERIRLSSIEPAEFDKRIIALIADPDSRLCAHAHVPLQSGDNTILRHMGRPYTRETFAGVIEYIRRAAAEAAIGTDVLVGFPGEDDTAFENTFALIQSLPLTYLHVFPFSPRKGTPAAGFEGKVPERIVKDRCQRLRRLGARKKAAFYQSLNGRTVDVIVQTPCEPGTGLPSGLSGNYVPVLLEGAGCGQIQPNSRFRALVNRADGDRAVFATVVSRIAGRRVAKH